MKRETLFAGLLLAITLAAGGLRLPHLANRPMHADEAVQAARFRQLWQHGDYVYDPHEFHGPTLMYATLPAARLSGATSFAATTEWTYRIVPAVFGIGLILVLGLLRTTLGCPAVLCAAVLAACSPAMVFYSRYYIHETLLAFFTVLTLGCAGRYLDTRALRWCLLAGAGLGLMQATKETAAIAYLAAALATLVTLPVHRPWRNRGDRAVIRRTGQHLVAATAVAMLVATLLFSSLGTNWHGPLDGIRTYLPWLARAGGESPHIHPWYFYLQRLAWWKPDQAPAWSEATILVLATIGLCASLVPCCTTRSGPSLIQARTHRVQWLALYTLATLAIYSGIPYKTPWCMLQMLVGLVLLAGYGAATLLGLANADTPEPNSTTPDSPDRPVRATSHRGNRSRIARLGLAIITVLLLCGVGQLARQAYRASFLQPADGANPYNYVPTSMDVLRLADQLTQLAEARPQEQAPEVQVVWQDPYYWPLPWYLRGFPDVQWRTQLPDVPPTPILITSPAYDAALTARLGEDYIMTGYYQLRPRVLAQLWVQFDLWEAHLKRLGRL